MPTYEVAARVRCSAPPERVWPVLADLDRWGAVPGAAVQLEEVDADPPNRLRYRIVEGIPVRDHVAEVLLVAVGGGTDIRWSHRFRARIPGSGGFLRTRLEKQAAEAASGLAEAASVA